MPVQVPWLTATAELGESFPRNTDGAQSRDDDRTWADVPYDKTPSSSPAFADKRVTPPPPHTHTPTTGQTPPRSMAPNSSPAMTNHAAAATLQTRAPQLQATWERYAETVQHNVSTRHPVFFTGKLRRPPSSLGHGTGMSPVAHGYVYQDGRRADGNSAPKL